MAVTLEVGDRAPAFTLRDQDGNPHRLQDYRGQTVVLYFYPRDETPGCTAEACSFRDRFAESAEFRESSRLTDYVRGRCFNRGRTRR